jgi:hypothetical protein
VDVTLTTKLRSGTRVLPCFELIYEIVNGNVVDFPYVSSDQRPAVIDLFAAMIRVGFHYGARASWSADMWAKMFSEVPTNLFAAPRKGAFLQPVLPDDYVYTTNNLEDLQGYPSASNHFVKPTLWSDVETATIALINSTRAGYGGRGYHSTARCGITAVYPSDDLSVSSEIMHLVAAMPVSHGTKKHNLVEHFLWAVPWTPDEGIQDLPYPLVQCREARLVDSGNGITLVQFAPNVSVKARVRGSPDDPHVVMKKGTAASLKLFGSADWTSKHLLATMFGLGRCVTPPILMGTNARFLRLTGRRIGQGKAVSAHETILRIDINGGIDQHRGARLASRAIEISAAATSCFRRAAATFFQTPAEFGKPVKDDAARKVAPAVARVDTVVTDELLYEVVRLIQRDEDVEAEETSMIEVATRTVWAQWESYTKTLPPIAVGKASKFLTNLLRKALSSDERFSMQDAFEAVKPYFATLASIDRRMSDDQRASIRSTAAATVPYQAIVALTHVDQQQLQTDYQRAVWISAIRALSNLRHQGPPIGRVLAATDYPENRLQALLAASDSGMVGQIDEISRWIGSRRSVANLSDLVALALTGDQKIRLKIGLDYAQASGAR